VLDATSVAFTVIVPEFRAYQQNTLQWGILPSLEFECEFPRHILRCVVIHVRSIRIIQAGEALPITVLGEFPRSVLRSNLSTAPVVKMVYLSER